MARLLQGGVLTGETGRLRARIAQFYERVETQLRQVLREGAAATGNPRVPVHEAAWLLLAVVEGRIAQFVRTDFGVSPVDGWEAQWTLLRTGLAAR
jgi:TetR/AcrR family transcriptional regulator